MAVGILYRQPESCQISEILAADEYVFARDVATTLVNNYSELVWQTTSSYLSSMSAEFAYGRLLGARGALCRICPTNHMRLLAPRTLESWEAAEKRLQNYFAHLSEDDVLFGVARQVEARWTQSVEAFLRVMSARVMGDEIPEHLGLLRGIDSVALHLAQRELFQWSQYFNVSSANTKALKLRIRLFALFLSTRRLDFNTSYPAIRSYRETFGIADRQAYPWWFVDCDLTERQMNWTHRRLNNESLGWRF
jgi:hypothetical protein